MSTSLLSQASQKKSSKYLISSIDPSPEYFLFVIHLESKKKSKKIQKITIDNTKYLINPSDKINYKKYEILKCEILSINNPLFSHKIEINLNQNYIIHKDQTVYIEIKNSEGYLTLFYNLENDILN